MKKLGLLFSICFLAVVVCSGLFFSCADEKAPPSFNQDTTIAKSYGGFSILNRLPGIWNGSLVSGTDLGNAPEWILDFRPIGAGQLLASAELDTQNDIFLGFFGCRYGADTVLVFRNGGHWGGRERISYCRLDSLSETGASAYYRFVDFIKGKSNLRASFHFKNDSLYLEVYTFKGFHFRWAAQKVDTTACLTAIQTFQYPKRDLKLDLTNAFHGKTISTYYNGEADPYAESLLPYVGKVNCTIDGDAGHPLNSVNRVFTVLSAQPLFVNNLPNTQRIAARSRYIILNPANASAFSFPNVHPGYYFINTFADRNGNGAIDSGDYLALPFDQTVTLPPNSEAQVTQTLNMTIP